jgi:hypothetical protein
MAGCFASRATTDPASEKTSYGMYWLCHCFPRFRTYAVVLRYTRAEKHRQTVRRHYDRWRESQGKPQCCDMSGCEFNKEPPLVWNGQALPLILDHTNGVNSDNRPENLRLLCPNCNEQQDTHGGRNIGRVADRADGGFAVISKSTGVREFVLPAESGIYRISGSERLPQRVPKR